MFVCFCWHLAGSSKAKVGGQLVVCLLWRFVLPQQCGFNMHFISFSNVVKAWNKVMERCVSDAWGKLCPKSTHNFKGLKNVIPVISKEILVIARHVGFIE